MPQEFTIEKRGNVPVILGRPLFDEWFRKYPDQTRFSVVFTRQGHKRSNSQNAYYWAVIVKSFQYGALEEWGEYKDEDQCHETLKANCLFIERLNEKTGEVIRDIGSTRDNDTWDQETYHDKCRKLIYEFFGIDVPLPNEGQVEMFRD
jgi:hypothetical protein